MTDMMGVLASNFSVRYVRDEEPAPRCEWNVLGNFTRGQTAAQIREFGKSLQTNASGRELDCPWLVDY